MLGIGLPAVNRQGFLFKMKTLLLVTKEDITCSINGEHFEITAVDGTIINLTKEAIDELVADYISLYIFNEEGKSKQKPNFDINITHDLVKQKIQGNEQDFVRTHIVDNNN